uniref:Possible tRNA binding domain-containing protein n=1 Tax=Grammatophora oceanica TaxID=210454 RepID=A0A7S1VCJ4_9STRA
MFNKAIRKISIALNTIVEDNERKSMLGGEERAKVERTVLGKMRDVSRQTLEEDASASATVAMRKLDESTRRMPQELANDNDIMQYAVKGSDDQWSKALKDREVKADGPSTFQIQTPTKRSIYEEDQKDAEGATERRSGPGGKRSSKKHKSSSRKKKAKNA